MRQVLVKQDFHGPDSVLQLMPVNLYEREELPDFLNRQRRVVFVDILDAFSKLCVFHNRVRKDARTLHDRTPRDFTWNLLDKLAAGPVHHDLPPCPIVALSLCKINA